MSTHPTPQVDPSMRYLNNTRAPAYGRPRVSLTHALGLWARGMFRARGRASRSEFWWAALVVLGIPLGLFLTGFVMALTTGSTAATPDTAAVGLGALSALLGLLGVAAMLTLMARRLHDTNLSGAWLVLLVGGPVGLVVLAVLLLRRSRPAGARFDDPYDPAQP